MAVNNLKALSLCELRGLWDKADDPSNGDRIGGATKGEIWQAIQERSQERGKFDVSTAIHQLVQSSQGRLTPEEEKLFISSKLVRERRKVRGNRN